MGVSKGSTNLKWSQAKRVILRDGQCCRWCGKHLELWEITFDHLKPKSEGGKATYENMIVACQKDNNNRHHRSFNKKLKPPKRGDYEVQLLMGCGQNSFGDSPFLGEQAIKNIKEGN